jgi:sugar/nucleoside kinase (ribokinase family)
VSDILIVGIAVVDAIARTVEAFPAPGGLRFFDDLTITTGGCAVNAAIALARLGVGADVVARVGADMLGDFVSSELHRHSLSTRLLVRDRERTTSFSFAAVGRAGERSFLHTTGANAKLARADVPHEELRTHSFLFVAGSMLMDTLDGEPTADLLRDARAAGATTLLDTVFVEGSPREEWQRRLTPALPHLDYFIPSHAEARALSGLDEPAAAAAQFRAAGARNVIIKLGDRGAYWLDHAGANGIEPACGVPTVADATGAGDCWAAGFLAGLRERLPMPDAAQLGNAVAACGIQAVGATAGVPSLAEVRSRWPV